MLTVIQIEHKESVQNRSSITDQKIQNSLDGRRLFRDLSCSTLEEIAGSLVYVHQFAHANMVVETANEELVGLIKEEANKNNISDITFH